MAADIELSVDPNAADLDQLQQLPGVGPRLAQRIIDARPFESVADLSQVEGIGGSVLENLRPYLEINSQKSEATTVQAALAPAPAGLIEAEGKMEPEPMGVEVDQAELDEALLEEEASIVEPEGSAEAALPHGVEAAIAELPVEDMPAEGEPVGEPETEAEPAPEATVQPVQAKRVEAGQPAYITQGQAVLLAFASGLLALLLGLALSLGIVAGVNQGRLQFASPAQVNNLSVRVDGIATQADTLAGDLEGLRARVGNLESLSGRVGSLEQGAETLRSDLDAASAQVEQMDSQLSDLGAQVETLQTENERFSTFLEGLRGLMEQIFGQSGGQE